MLLPYIACDRCYCHFWYYLVTDVVVTCCSMWLMLLSHCINLVIGRCYAMWCSTTFNVARGHWYLPMADVIAIFDLLGWCYCLVLIRLADVIASGWCYCHICSYVWLMLLPWWLMLYPPMGELADVIAKVAWWNSHWVNLILILMLCTGPHPIYEADGICLCSC